MKKTILQPEDIVADPRFHTFPEWKALYAELLQKCGSEAPYLWAAACNLDRKIRENKTEDL